jgi:hypothetical protein
VPYFIQICFTNKMSISKSEQKQIENEMIFRRVNEKAGDGLDALDAMHIEDDNPQFIRDDDTLLQFNCECSDENCDARIPIQLSIYKTIHENRSTFIVKPDHQVDPIEEVIKKTKEYNVVRKNNTTPEPNDKLKDTSIDNR